MVIRVRILPLFEYDWFVLLKSFICVHCILVALKLHLAAVIFEHWLQNTSNYLFECLWTEFYRDFIENIYRLFYYPFKISKYYAVSGNIIIHLHTCKRLNGSFDIFCISMLFINFHKLNWRVWCHLMKHFNRFRSIGPSSHHHTSKEGPIDQSQ